MKTLCSLGALLLCLAGLSAQTLPPSDLAQIMGTLAAGDSGDVTVTSEDSQKLANETKAPVVLRVDSIPTDVVVGLNFAQAGRTPLELRNLTAGSYRVVLSKEGYQSIAVNVELREAKTVSIAARLRQLTGLLSLSAEPADCIILLDGSRISTGVNEFPIGEYELRVRKFGYAEQSARVSIRHRQTTQLSVRLSKAVFDLKNAGLSRARFNPDNPGLLGRATLHFEVSAPGAGRLRVLDPAGTTVAVHDFAPFTAWDQSWSWNGRSDAAEFVPDGIYRFVLELRPADGSAALERSWEAVVDRSLRMAYRSLPAGLSGALLSADSLILPQGGLQLSSELMAGVDPGWGRPSAASYPIGLTGRMGFAPGWEAGLGATARIKPTSDPPDLAVTAAVKHGLAVLPSGPGLGAALFLQGGYASADSVDAQGSATGLRLGGVLEGRWAWLHLALSPALEWVVLEALARLQLRAGLLADLGPFMSGASASASFELPPRGFRLAYPLRLAGELHALVGDTSLYLSGLGMLLFYESWPPSLELGLGVGFLY